MICGGVDAGSRAIKVVLVDSDGPRVVGAGVVEQGVNQAQLAKELFEDVVAKAALSCSDVKSVVATGYGRSAVTMAATTVTEITCHARGVRHLHPEVRTVIDIGGQDSKLVRLDEDGRVRDFVLNDRCAAGTGRFLEVVADRLGVGLAELGSVASAATAPAVISSMCVVFAESEIVGLLAAREMPANIVAGVQTAIASRMRSMAGRAVTTPVVFAGGVAMIPGMSDALACVLGVSVTIASDPQMTGALGAALIALERPE